MVVTFIFDVQLGIESWVLKVSKVCSNNPNTANKNLQNNAMLLKDYFEFESFYENKIPIVSTGHFCK